MSDVGLELLNLNGKQALIESLRESIPELPPLSVEVFEAYFQKAFAAGLANCQSERIFLEGVYEGNSQLYGGATSEVPLTESIFVPMLQEILNTRWWGSGCEFDTTEIRCLRADRIIPFAVLGFKSAFEEVCALLKAETSLEAKAIVQICTRALLETASPDNHSQVAEALQSPGDLTDIDVGQEHENFLGTGFTNRYLADYLTALATKDQLGVEDGYYCCSDQHIGAFQVAYALADRGDTFEDILG